MKLATYKDGSRDGQLVVVSRDLASAHFATGIATRLQQVIDDWNFLSPQLEDLSATLNGGKARHAFAFDPALCMAPLPRAVRWAEAAAGGPVGDPRRGAPGANMSGAGPVHLSIAHGPGDEFLGPCDEARFADETDGIDFGAGLAVVTGDVDAGASAGRALEGIRLLTLANSWALRESHSGAAAGDAVAFGPVAVTPDELGEAWQGGRVHLNLECHWNDKRVGLVDAAAGMSAHFGQIVAQLATRRRVRAGSVVGSGPLGGGDGSRGFACVADKRARETLEHGEPRTPFMRFGDTVRLEMRGRDGLSVFGAIAQAVAPLQVA